MFDVWMRLLKSVPDSVLWLLEDNAAAKRNLGLAAAERGIDPARLIFAPRVPSPVHLARHRLADLFLDTLPYNAHTTASDALWAGLPVLTCLGGQFDGRVAASLLETMGLPELVTSRIEDYESLALALAHDPARLAALKIRLAANRLSSPLFDTDGFRRSIEAAYLRMMEIAREGRAPESFAITR
jgi:predicted O-linked N-acetylglucosamine transferase (SPINDLY family)